MFNQKFGYCAQSVNYTIDCDNCGNKESQEHSYNLYEPLQADPGYGTRVVCSKCGFKSASIKPYSVFDTLTEDDVEHYKKVLNDFTKDK